MSVGLVKAGLMLAVWGKKKSKGLRLVLEYIENYNPKYWYEMKNRFL